MKNYKAVINVKDCDEVIFKANDIYEGYLDDEILTLYGEGDFEYKFTSQELIANFIEV